MKTTHVIATFAILATAGSAFANSIAAGEYVDHSGFVSTKTRAQVREELQQARPNGLLAQGENVTFEQPNIGARGPAGARPSIAAKTRAQVTTELEQARANGLIKPGEHVGK